MGSRKRAPARPVDQKSKATVHEEGTWESVQTHPEFDDIRHAEDVGDADAEAYRAVYEAGKAKPRPSARPRMSKS